MKRFALAVMVVALAAAGCVRDADQAAPTAAPQPSGTTEPSTPANDCRLEGAGTDKVSRSGEAHETALLEEIDHNTAGCPRVVLRFENSVPATYRVEYQTQPQQCGSGENVDASGWGANAFLVFHASTASGVDDAGPELRYVYEGERDIAISSPILKRLHSTCDFEDELEWVIALDEKRPFKAFTLEGPPRLVVDIQQAT